MIGNIMTVLTIVLVIVSVLFIIIFDPDVMLWRIEDYEDNEDNEDKASYIFEWIKAIVPIASVVMLIAVFICTINLKSKDNTCLVAKTVVETHQIVQVKLKSEKEARGNGSGWILFGTDTMSSSEERAEQSYYRFYVKMSGGIKQMKVSAGDTIIKYVKPGEKPHYDEIKTTKITRVKKALHSQFGWLADAIDHDFANDDTTEVQRILYVPENVVK